MSDTPFVLRPVYGWMQRIVATLLEIIMIVIFSTYLVHYHRYLQAMNRTSQKHLSFKPGEKAIIRWRRLSHIFTMITLATYCIQGLLYCFNAWSIYPSHHACKVYEKFSVWLYHVGKFSLYMVLVLRIRVVFHGSAFHRFVNRTLRIMYIFLFIFIVLATIGDFLTIDAKKVHIDNDVDNKVSYCVIEELVVWGLAGFISADLIISVLCLILFNYPLKRLLKQCDIEDMEIMLITKKYAILTTTAILSTTTLIFLVGVTHFGWLSLLDNVINSLCLLFMSAFYSRYYDMLCGCCMNIEFEELTQRSKTITATVRAAAAQWTDSQFGTGFDPEHNNGHFSGSEAHRLRLGTPLPETDEPEKDKDRHRDTESEHAVATRNRITSVEDAFAMVRSMSPPTKMSNTLAVPYGASFNGGSLSPVKNIVLETDHDEQEQNVLDIDNEDADTKQVEQPQETQKLAMHQSVSTQSVDIQHVDYEENQEEEEEHHAVHVDIDTNTRPKGLSKVNSSSASFDDEAQTFEP